jgi:hypothetical protein
LDLAMIRALPSRGDRLFAIIYAIHRRALTALGLALLAALGPIACGPSARDIAEARARYVAALDGFVVRQEPVAGESSAPPRLKQDVELDLIVRRETDGDESPEALPGITLDLDQVDAAGTSRRHWRVWVETAGLAPGRELRMKHVLEDVEYGPGDGFRVEMRQDVPAGERAAYREWGGSTGSGPTS